MSSQIVLDAGGFFGGALEGRITRTMRAVGATAAGKVLRIATVRGDRIVAERLVRGRADVTIGAGEDAMLGGRRETFKLFEARDGAYNLNVVDGMEGRISTGDAVVAVDELRRILPREGAAHPLRLTDAMRGRVTLDGEVLLFQFVAAPIASRPALPPALRRTLGVDWNLALVSAFTFAAHFGLLAYAFTTWDAQVPQQTVGTVEVLDTSETAFSTPKVETSNGEHARDGNDSSRSSATESSSPRVARPGGARPGMSASRDPSAAFAAALAHMNVSLAPSDPAPSRVPVPGPDDPNPHSLLPGMTVPGTIDPGTSPDPTIPWRPTSPVPGDPGRVRTIVPDPGVRPDPVSPPAAALPDAEAVIHAQLAPAVHACYERGLGINPGEHGNVTVFIRVGANGEVSSATVSGSGIDANSLGCIRYAAGRIQFRPSASGGSVSAPFSLLQP